MDDLSNAYFHLAKDYITEILNSQSILRKGFFSKPLPSMFAVLTSKKKLYQ